MADPDLELKGRGGGGVGLDFLALLAFFPSVICSFFTQNKGGGAGPPGPSPRSATGLV